MQNRNRLFEKTDDTFLSISYDKFIDAIKKGNTERIDAILAAKKNGYELDINKEEYGKTALEILLEKRDFTNAAKLIKAGAKTEIEYLVWVDDDMSYPYAHQEMRSRSVLNSAKLTKDDLLELANIQATHKGGAASDEKVVALRR